MGQHSEVNKQTKENIKYHVISKSASILKTYTVPAETMRLNVTANKTKLQLRVNQQRRKKQLMQPAEQGFFIQQKF